MPNLDLPILVVDDAKFSSTIVGKALKNAGYRDVRVANTAPAALKEMETRAVSVLIADWLMPDMDGLELTDRVRQLDEHCGHYTYIILLTAKESVSALTEAFDRGVDDFVYKSDMSKQLLPRVFAADRLADRHNTMLMANRLLMENNRELESRNIIDLDTGLANSTYARQRLNQGLRHIEARGGATGYLMIGIRNWKEIKRRQSASTMADLAASIGRRLTHLVRPMDALCRVDESQFAIIAHFDNVDQCKMSAFRRIHDGLNHKAFKTAAGYIAVEPATALCVCGNADRTPDAASVEKAAVGALMEAYETRTLVETTLVGNSQTSKQAAEQSN